MQHKIDRNKDEPASQPHPHGMSSVLLPGVATPRRSLNTARFQHRVQQDFAASNSPQTTPTNHLPTRRLRTHNTTSQLHFLCVFESFFFSFPPDFVCSAIHPWPPTRFPAHLTSRIRSTNAIASLDELCGPHPPPNHATTAAPIALSLLPLPCHPRTPLYMPALKPRTRTTRKACRGPHFCGGSNW